MNISVSCPICCELLKCEFDGTLHGQVTIGDLGCMEVTVPAEISRHIDTHRIPSADGTGFQQDPRYWVQLRRSLELHIEFMTKRLESLGDVGVTQ